VVFGGVAGQRGELRLEAGNVVVPAVRIWVLFDRGCRLDLLENFDIGLGRGVAATLSVEFGPSFSSDKSDCEELNSEMRQARGFVVVRRGLKPPHKHGPMFFIRETERCGRKEGQGIEETYPTT